jgi:hypothetical protein
MVSTNKKAKKKNRTNWQRKNKRERGDEGAIKIIIKFYNKGKKGISKIHSSVSV